jgi:phage shock protein PspC (stress-responsive transcriptional regulator)
MKNSILARPVLRDGHEGGPVGRRARGVLKMEATRESLFRRDDTFLGVCQALGDDFGFNPIFLRIAFALPVIYAPLLTIEVYLGLGLIVLASRLLAPRPKRKAAPQVEAVEPAATAAAAPAVPAEAVLAETDADQYVLSMAA